MERSHIIKCTTSLPCSDCIAKDYTADHKCSSHACLEKFNEYIFSLLCSKCLLYNHCEKICSVIINHFKEISLGGKDENNQGN